MTRQKVLTELSPLEKAHALVVLGRGIGETFQGLDIVPPSWAVMVEYDGIPLICSNMKNRPDLIEYVAMTRDHLVHGDNIVPICVPTRQTLRQSFLKTMRIARGTHKLPVQDLRGLVITYVMG